MTHLFSPAHKWLQIYRGVLLILALIISYNVQPTDRLLILNISWLSLLAYAAILILKNWRITLLNILEPYPAILIDIILISIIVKVTGGVSSVFHPLYVIEFLHIGYFYDFKKTVFTGAIASIGFLLASETHHNILHSTLHIMLTFCTALFVGAFSRKSTVLKKSINHFNKELDVRASELARTKNVLRSLHTITATMTKTFDIKDIIYLLESYAEYIRHTERALIILSPKVAGATDNNEKGLILIKNVLHDKPIELRHINTAETLQKLDLLDQNPYIIIDADYSDEFFKLLQVTEPLSATHNFLKPAKSLIISPINYKVDNFGLILLFNCNYVHAFGAEQLEIAATLSYSVAIYCSSLDAISKLDKHFYEVVKLLANVVDLRDEFTHNHSRNVAKYARQIGAALNFENSRMQQLTIASLLHDIGKVGIPDAILKKPGSLTAKEFELIKAYPTAGSYLLSNISGFDDIARFIEQHHERFDGTGYPYGLEGENICFEARIINLADAFDAMTSNRHYRSRMSKDKAIAEIKKMSGKQFDPKLVAEFLEILEQNNKLSG